MITKIILENFMAHAHTELELGEGVNALTGPNNTGKSAIVEALRCIATNPVPKHYIRHGAKEARVTVELEDGTRVIWIRKKRSSGYELWEPGAEEAQEYWKFGRKPPEDVLAALRLDLVELEGDKDPIDVHIGNQRDPVFLLNQPKSDAAAFFAASTESAHLLAMQNLLKRKTQESKRQEKELNSRISAIETALDRFSPLPDIEMVVEKARELESSAKQLQAEIPALENGIKTRKNLDGSLADLRASSLVLDRIKTAPKLSETSGLSLLLQQITEVDHGLKSAQSVQEQLVPLATPPEVENTGRMALVCNELQRLDRALSAARRREGVSAGLSTSPQPESVRQLSELMDEILAANVRFQRENRRHGVLANVAEPPQLVESSHLQSLLQEMVGLENQAKGAESGLEKLEMELQSLEKGIRERLDELGHCPTCGNELSGVEFLDRGCSHDA